MGLIIVSVNLSSQEPLSKSFSINPNEIGVDIEKPLQKSAQINETLYFPIQIISFKSSTGEGGMKEVYFERWLYYLNAAYSSSNIQFILCSEPRYINNDYFYDFKVSRESELANLYNNPKAINLYLVNTIYDELDNNYYIGYANFPWWTWLDNNFIIIKNNYGDPFWIHEFGHYFGLLHTYETSRGVEFVNQSNCSTAGDLICDTPADREDLITPYNTCIYSGNDADENGDTFTPDTKNFMGSSSIYCWEHFTPMQNQRLYHYASTYRAHLVGNSELKNSTITNDLILEDNIIEIENISIENNSNVEIKYCKSVSINGEFVVDIGSSLQINK